MLIQILTNTLERAKQIHKEDIALDKMRNPEDPEHQSYWTGYWAGYSCSLQHCIDLIHSNKFNGTQVKEPLDPGTVFPETA